MCTLNVSAEAELQLNSESAFVPEHIGKSQLIIVLKKKIQRSGIVNINSQIRMKFHPLFLRARWIERVNSGSFDF